MAMNVGWRRYFLSEKALSKPRVSAYAFNMVWNRILILDTQLVIVLQPQQSVIDGLAL